MKIKRYGSMQVYQQLGLLQTLPPKKIKPRFVKPEVRHQGDTIILDNWTKPILGKEVITLT